MLADVELHPDLQSAAVTLGGLVEPDIAGFETMTAKTSSMTAYDNLNITFSCLGISSIYDSICLYLKYMQICS